jgi:hypothetical protein
MISTSLLAYIGPGLGVGTIVIILIIVMVILVSLLMILWIPIKNLIKKIIKLFNR